VAEGVLIGDQLDEALAAVGVQGHDLLAGHGRGMLPHLPMMAIGEGVLGVELELIDSPLRQQIHQRVQGVHSGNLVPADVQHDASVGKVGPVLDAQAGQFPHAGALASELPHRHGGVERACRVVGHDVDAIRADGQAIPLGPGRLHGVHVHDGLSLRLEAMASLQTMETLGHW